MRPLILALWLAASPLAHAQSKPNEPTPEQDRASLVKAIQKSFPGVPVTEWSLAGITLKPGVAVSPLGGAHATNINDILAIGKKQWERKFKNGKSLAACFPAGGRRAATAYPQFDARQAAIITLEMAVSQCLHANAEDSFDPLRMGAVIAHVRSLAINDRLNLRALASAADSAARAHYQNGRQWFTRRLGERDLACASCHVLQAGKIIDGAAVAPAVGMVLAWPRVEPGGSIRSLQRQFQLCMTRVGAEPFMLQSPPFNDLEFFLSMVANGLVVRPAIATQ